MEKLPIEIITKILKFVSRNERKSSASLVNKTFYAAVCLIDDSSLQVRLCLENFSLKNNEKYQSLMTSSKKLSSFDVNLISDSNNQYPTQQVLESFKILLQKFGFNIKKFYIASRLQLLDFLEILHLIPNVESLTLYDFYEAPPAKKRCIRDTSDLNLHHLKELGIYSEDVNIVKSFLRLPAGVLKTLSFHAKDDEEVLKKIVAKQSNIEWIYCGAKVSLDTFKHLKLKNLIYMSDSDDGLEFFLKQQPSLKTLTLDLNITHNLMQQIKNLKHLEELTINIDDIDIEAIEQLPKVRKLELRGSNSQFIEVLADQDNSHINFLAMDTYVPCRITLEKLSTSMPNLKSIELFCMSDSLAINHIMRVFNQVEKLQIYNESLAVMRNSTKVLCRNDLRNEKLKVLEISHTFRFKNNFAQKIVESYPNLEKLVVRKDSLDSIQELLADRVARTETLKKLTKLTEISIAEYPVAEEVDSDPENTVAFMVGFNLFNMLPMLWEDMLSDEDEGEDYQA